MSLCRCDTGSVPDKNREFAELVGIPEPEDWMCSYDFATDPRLVLREIKRLGKLDEFLFHRFGD